MKFINIGFGNMVAADRIITIVSPDSAPVKRLIQDAKDAGRIIDVSCGRRTRAVIITDSDHVILSAIQTETISNRNSHQQQKFCCFLIKRRFIFSIWFKVACQKQKAGKHCPNDTPCQDPQKLTAFPEPQITANTVDAYRQDSSRCQNRLRHRKRLAVSHSFLQKKEAKCQKYPCIDTRAAGT